MERCTIRTIGLIGGCSAESTAIYYAHINSEVRRLLPGHGARILLWSFDFEEINSLIEQDDWAAAADKFVDAASWLEHGGADGIVICTNTMHKIAGEVADAIDVPLIHLIDETAKRLHSEEKQRPLLLGTRFTMEQSFYADRLRENGLDPLLPEPRDRERVHRIIYEELIEGRIEPPSTISLIEIIRQAETQGADSVILGCTELGLLFQEQRPALPVFDTAIVHADAAVRFALEIPSASMP